MNTQTQEALKMAIEALEKLARLGNGDSYGNSDGNCIAISALKAITFALAQPEQEPVAWMEVKKDAGFKCIEVWQEPVSKNSIPLYTHPAPSWQGLSDDEIENKLKWFQDNQIFTMQMRTEMEWASIWFNIGVQWAEQALKEKNHV